MEPIIRADQRVIAAVARQVRRWSAGAGCDLHALLFVGATALYLVLWAALCRLERQPDYLWFVLGAGFGAIGGWLAGRDPVVELEPGIALTSFGLDKRWALMRLTYLPLAAVALLPLLAGDRYSALFILVTMVEVLLFAAMEYLLCFRLMGEGERVIMGMVFGPEQLPAMQAGGSSGGPAAGSDLDEEPTEPRTE